MKLFDVTVMVAAFRADHPDHDTPCRTYVERCLASSEQVAVPWSVWRSFLRVVTHPRIFDPPATTEDALAAHHGATIVTYDRDFARFPDLLWETPALS